MRLKELDPSFMCLFLELLKPSIRDTEIRPKQLKKKSLAQIHFNHGAEGEKAKPSIHYK